MLVHFVSEEFSPKCSEIGLLGNRGFSGIGLDKKRVPNLIHSTSQRFLISLIGKYDITFNGTDSGICKTYQ